MRSKTEPAPEKLAAAIRPAYRGSPGREFFLFVIGGTE
jgi:hypothetical protein